jgi:hypothetical protein
MAAINDRGNIIAHCPTCDGAKSTFECVGSRGDLGHVTKIFPRDYRHYSEDRLRVRFQLFQMQRLRCWCVRGDQNDGCSWIVS